MSLWKRDFIWAILSYVSCLYSDFKLNDPIKVPSTFDATLNIVY